ncbi:hypothetical protein AX16_004530 [Volvariella volvacea WC 439]|nr:hypothetical protein AX16_004530 [Volvariella volvacea WC 439]
MFLKSTIFFILCSLDITYSQQVGTVVAEVHPRLSWSKCTSSGCQSVSGSITLDVGHRWIHSTSGYTNCYSGNTWNTTICPDGITCARNCAVEGADYGSTNGITTSGNSITFKIIELGERTDTVSRVYLMNTESRYQMFYPLNQEITFDVDISKLPCGTGGALYFVSMEEDGGMKYPTNKAGAKYGTGYCDSSCPRDLKFINGEASNYLGWTPSPYDPYSGTGNYGSCCSEVDVWEANSLSAVYTAHPCTVLGPSLCSGTTCTGNSVCDPDGCDFNSYRLGDTSYYGPGGTGVDTRSKFTVVTQFHTHNKTSSGVLSEIRRLYVQNGRIIQNSRVRIGSMGPYDSINSEFCDVQKAAFGDPTTFQDKGGMEATGKALAAGMVLVMSNWRQVQPIYTPWLDGIYPAGADPSTPGVKRGPCPVNTGSPGEIEAPGISPSVTFSNIRFGDIGTTYVGGWESPTLTIITPTITPTTSAPGPAQTKWGQW